MIDEREFHFGDIYKINDKLISLPRSDRIEGGRNYHPERWIVVISNNEENYHPLCPVVTVAPLSHRTDLKRPFDLELFKERDDVKYDCLLSLQAKQSILKVDLHEYKGSISYEKKEELLALIAMYYGLDEDDNNNTENEEDIEAD